MKKDSLEAAAIRMPQEETIQEIVRLPEGMTKAILAMAVHVMERTLECYECPHREGCGETVEECERAILDELMTKIGEGGKSHAEH